MDEPTSFTNAPAGHPASISDPASAAQANPPAGATWTSYFFIVHHQHDPATDELVGSETYEISEHMLMRFFALLAELPEQRVMSLDAEKRRRLFGGLGEGVNAELALQAIEAEGRVH